MTTINAAKEFFLYPGIRAHDTLYCKHAFTRANRPTLSSHYFIHFHAPLVVLRVFSVDDRTSKVCFRLFVRVSQRVCVYHIRVSLTA